MSRSFTERVIPLEKRQEVALPVMHLWMPRRERNLKLKGLDVVKNLSAGYAGTEPDQKVSNAEKRTRKIDASSVTPLSAQIPEFRCGVDILAAEKIGAVLSMDNHGYDSSDNRLPDDVLEHELESLVPNEPVGGVSSKIR